METVALIPMTLGALLLCFQVVLVGIAFVYAGVAAESAARAVSIGQSPQTAASSAIPAGLRSGLSVSAGPSSVTVRLHPSLLVGSGISRSTTIDVDHRVVQEPR